MHIGKPAGVAVFHPTPPGGRPSLGNPPPPRGGDRRVLWGEISRWGRILWGSVVSNVRLGVLEAAVEGKRGSFMSVSVHSVHNNILPHIATQRCLFGCNFHPWLFPAWLSCTSGAPGNMHLPPLLAPLVMGMATSICSICRLEGGRARGFAALR